MLPMKNPRQQRVIPPAAQSTAPATSVEKIWNPQGKALLEKQR